MATSAGETRLLVMCGQGHSQIFQIPVSEAVILESRELSTSHFHSLPPLELMTVIAKYRSLSFRMVMQSRVWNHIFTCIPIPFQAMLWLNSAGSHGGELCYYLLVFWVLDRYVQCTL